MDYIKMARELGAEIQKTEEFKTVELAKVQNDADTGLEKLIGEFNMKRMDLGNEMQKEEQDKAKIEAIDNELKGMYASIMENENMKAFNDAKTAFDDILQQINTIIMMSANGQDPMTIDPKPNSCGDGGCSSCSGCH